MATHDKLSRPLAGRGAEPRDRLPAPTGPMHALMGLLRWGPLPLAELRPAAAAVGMTAPEIDAALAVATRRQVLGLAMIGGVACVERRRPSA